MSEKKRAEARVTVIKAKSSESSAIRKSDKSEQKDPVDRVDSSEWISPAIDLRGLKELEQHSSILPQCVRAYKNNIAGFGIGVRYIDDVDETPEMAAEYTRAEELIELLNFEQDTKEVFEDLVEAREIYGIAYLEVIRNIGGEVVQIEFVKDTPSIEKTRLLEPYIDTTFFYKGTEQVRKKKFRKYRQIVNGQTVYFKEFGDPRVMDKHTGEYAGEGGTIDLDNQANEIMEFAIGTMPYGEVRWIGQILGVDGSRRAESLNNNYFTNGRHTPLMIMIKGGTLTEASFTKLREYVDGIKGEAGQHAFIVLETESSDNTAAFEGEHKADIEVKDLASILQKDELFQEYLDNNRRRVQSAFQLPDLYVGYTTDFNRATAQTAQEVTEKQVFQPERKSLAWAINNRLLNAYNFQYVECYFKEPDINNPDDMFKILSVCNNAGGITPNKAKEIAYTALGDNYEPFEGDWAETPLAVAKAQNGAQSVPAQLDAVIEKAAGADDDAIVAVLKEVKKLLKNLTSAPKRSIIENEWDESKHPRDEKGRFSSGFGGASSTDFAGAVSAAKQSLPADKAWRVAAHSAEELEKEYPGAELHITPGGSTVAVTADGDIISVCGRAGDSVRGRELLQLATDNGGVKLDSYSGNHGFYLNCGFEPVSWCKWNDDYAPPDWDSSRDKREAIVFYRYTGSQEHYTRAEAVEHLQAFQASTKASADYDSAQAIRDKSL